jgi:hypothetical protein
MRLGSLSAAKQGLIRGPLPNRECSGIPTPASWPHTTRRRIRGKLRFFTRRQSVVDEREVSISQTLLRANKTQKKARLLSHLPSHHTNSSAARVIEEA